MISVPKKMSKLFFFYFVGKTIKSFISYTVPDIGEIRYRNSEAPTWIKPDIKDIETGYRYITLAS